MNLGLDIGGTSVKAALVDGDRTVATGRSGAYSRPDRAGLARAVAEAVESARAGGAAIERVGMCAPGVLDEAGSVITAAINLPGIVGVPLRELAASAIGASGIGLDVFTDAHAAAFDVWWSEREGLSGRLLVISLGTGVGAGVLDDGRPLLVSGRSPGHFGQMDVTVEGSGREVPVGPDGGRGSLEAYIGAPALASRFGCSSEEAIERLSADRTPLRALVRAIRIGMAMYRPLHVRLVGGIGIRLAAHLGWIRGEVASGLSSIARPGWDLSCGTSDHHAALGAARLAARRD